MSKISPKLIGQAVLHCLDTSWSCFLLSHNAEGGHSMIFDKKCWILFGALLNIRVPMKAKMQDKSMATLAPVHGPRSSIGQSHSKSLSRPWLGSKTELKTSNNNINMATFGSTRSRTKSIPASLTDSVYASTILSMENEEMQHRRASTKLNDQQWVLQRKKIGLSRRTKKFISKVKSDHNQKRHVLEFITKNFSRKVSVWS